MHFWFMFFVIIWTLPHFWRVFPFLYVVICPFVELTSRVHKAVVRCVSLLNDFVSIADHLPGIHVVIDPLVCSISAWWIDGRTAWQIHCQGFAVSWVTMSHSLIRVGYVDGCTVGGIVWTMDQSINYLVLHLCLFFCDQERHVRYGVWKLCCFQCWLY